MKRPKKPVEAPRPQVGDYFASSYGDGNSIHLKIGPHWTDYAYITGCATKRGAERLAALMNAARDLARDFSDIGGRSLYKNVSARDWGLHCIAASLCEALDTPFPYFDWSEEARYSILYFEPRNGGCELAEFFALLDAAGRPADLDDDDARRVLLKRTSLGRRHFTEVIRAWRRSFDATTSAAGRAAQVIAQARTENRSALGLPKPEVA